MIKRRVQPWKGLPYLGMLILYRVRTILVHMKNITLSAPQEAIERGRRVASSRNTTLNELFRDWLEQLGEGELREQSYRRQMERLTERVRTGGRKFTREEMNERLGTSGVSWKDQTMIHAPGLCRVQRGKIQIGWRNRFL